MKKLLGLALISLTLVACGGGSSTAENPPEDDRSSGDETPSQSENRIPIADAGLSQTVAVGEKVQLSGLLSSDPEGDRLSYRWVFMSLPAGSSAALSDSTSSEPAFTADVAGIFELGLVVNDGKLDSQQDSVIITSQSSAPAALNYAIVDTNQTLCYDSATGSREACAGTGYDADDAGNQPDYTLSRDGITVTDHVTGLVWQQSSDTDGSGVVNVADKLSQSAAINYCESLSSGGRSDWRLPSIKELYSLILFSGEDPSGLDDSTDTSTLTPFIHTVFDWTFGDVEAGERIIDGQYASSTNYVSTTMNGDPTMFGVNFVDGRIKGYPLQLPSGATKSYYVRCVAGNTQYGENHFVENGDATISDSATALMWQQSDYESLNWDNAIAHCSAATTAGYSDWRLPNAKELQSILDYSRSPDSTNSAAIHPLFNATSFTNEGGETDWGAYWSSTTHVNHRGKGSSAAYVSFGRALGYMNDNLLDVHGAGAQRSDNKTDVSTLAGTNSHNLGFGTFYYRGPQGDILRNNNYVRCVRDVEAKTSSSIPTDGSVNILLIVADDLGVDNVNGYGEHPDSAKTPTLDQFIEQGAMFRNTWANAMCSPSRASLLTGRHPFRHGVTHPGATTGHLDSAEQTIAEALSDAGYQTALFGKWHLGTRAGQLPTDQGFDYFSGSLANLSEGESGTGYFNWVKSQITAQGGTKTDLVETSYATDVVATEAAEWIRQQTGPWFVEVAFNAPHAPFHVPPKETFSGVTLSGAAGDNCTSDEADDDRKACYRAMVESMDFSISELIAALDAQTLANTLIIFIGDNGTTGEGVIRYSSENHFFSRGHSKGTVYEGGVNVPLIIYGGRNVPVANLEVADLILVQDLFPTLIEIGNASSANLLDGHSLLGYLDQSISAPVGHETLFTELKGVSDVDRWAISDGNAKYINNEGAEECYNLVQDPAESANRWGGTADVAATCVSLKEGKPGL